jgi:sirohydrochlorin ferrochelatase
MQGWLVVGHGTRDARGIDEFHQAAEAIAERCRPEPVEPCFLELAEPAISEAVPALVRRGARRLVVSPLLLFGAGHVKRDIPRAVAAALRKQAEVTVCYAPPIECHEAIVALSAKRYRQAIAGLIPTPEARTVLVLVGRGSHDAQATAEMLRFARRRAQHGSLAEVATCFCAMAHPPLEETLSRVAALDVARIVVQPHLLFRGELLAAIGARVDDWRARDSSREWVVTAHLGPDPALTDAVIELASQGDSRYHEGDDVLS